MEINNIPRPGGPNPSDKGNPKGDVPEFKIVENNKPQREPNLEVQKVPLLTELASAAQQLALNVPNPIIIQNNFFQGDNSHITIQANEGPGTIDASVVTNNDLESLTEFLRMNGLLENEIYALEDAVKKDNNLSMGENVRRWYEIISGKILVAGPQLVEGTTASLIAQALWQYYGKGS